MNKWILIISITIFMPLFSKAQASKIAFIDWDSMRSQVNLYKTNELETARFKAFIQEIDSLKVIKFKANYDSFFEIYIRSSCSNQSKIIDKLKTDLEKEQKKAALFEELMPKIISEFETKSKEWTDDFFKLKIRYYADSQGFKAVYGVDKLLYNRDDFNKKIIELINKDENAKEAQRYFLNFLMNKIKFDYNLD